MASSVTNITLDPSESKPPYRDLPDDKHELVHNIPEPKSMQAHPMGKDVGGENARLYFIGIATTIIDWAGLRIMTDPNFLHAGDHVHLGPGVTATRQTNPSVDLHDLPRIDLVLLSHYHADHFDQYVESTLRRDLPIVTTPHAHKALVLDKTPASEAFTAVTPLDTWESAIIRISGNSASVPAPIVATGENTNKEKLFKVTAMPGKHVPPGPAGLLGKANELAGAIPPTNGWMIELGSEKAGASGEGALDAGYRIYVSGDTLFVDDLKDIPHKFPNVDLMLIHLGGTTIPGPSMPLLMVTMDASQGIQLVRLIKPDVTIPIHYDDYDVFLSPLDDFKKAMTDAGLDSKVVYLDRGDGYQFTVRD